MPKPQHNLPTPLTSACSAHNTYPPTTVKRLVYTLLSLIPITWQQTLAELSHSLNQNGLPTLATGSVLKYTAIMLNSLALRH